MPPGDATAHSRADNWTAAPNRSPRSVTGSPTLMPTRRWMGRSASFVPLTQRALDVDPGLDRARYGRERRHDSVARVLHLASVSLVQRGAYDFVVLTNEHHEALVAQFLSLFRGVTQVGEQNDPDRGLDIRFSGWVSGDVSKKRIDGPVPDLDDVVGSQAVCFPMDGFQGLPVGPLGEAEHRAFLVIEPVRDVTNLVLVLDGKVELVRGGDVGGCRSRGDVTVQEQGHAHQASDGDENMLLTRPRRISGWRNRSPRRETSRL